jgi:hypothetical protein
MVMTEVCDPLPGSVAKHLLRDAARSLCDRAGETAGQRQSRTNDMVHNVWGFRPRDGLEYMLATLMAGHFEMIMDSVHDVFQGQRDTVKARTKSTIVALDRTMLTMLREFRLARQRPLAQWAEDGLRAQEAEAEAAENASRAEAAANASPPEAETEAAISPAGRQAPTATETHAAANATGAGAVARHTDTAGLSHGTAKAAPLANTKMNEPGPIPHPPRPQQDPQARGPTDHQTATNPPYQITENLAALFLTGAPEEAEHNVDAFLQALASAAENLANARQEENARLARAPPD